MPVQRRRHTAALATVLSGFLLFAGLLLASPADAGTGADEQSFVQMINQTRAGAGLPPLTVHPELTRQARSWASSMANTDQLAHAPDISRGISAPWTVLGENVGVHGVRDIGQLHAAFVASPGHYANIVDARYTYVGVGVVVTAEGKLWTTHRFMTTAEPAPTTSPPTTSPPTTAAPTTAAPRPPTTAAPTTNRSTTTTAPRAPKVPTTLVDRATSAPTTSTTSPQSALTRSTAADVGTDGPPAGDAVASTGGIGEAWPDEQAPAATADGSDIEPVAAGPGRPDLATVEQMLIDLIEAGI